MQERKRPLHELEREMELKLSAIGVQLVDLEYKKEKGSQFLRLFIDRSDGVNLEVCSEVSRYIKEYIDNTSPLYYDYLEVSSPGINRRLKKTQDFEEHTGKRVKIKTNMVIEGRKNFLGILKNVVADNVEIEQDGCLVVIPISIISVARLHPNL